jgi:hypothetical protein
VITDHRPLPDDAVCIVYDLNSADESFEWFCLAAGVEGVEYRMSAAPPVDVLAMAAGPGGGSGGSGGGGGRDRRARPRPPRRDRGASAAGRPGVGVVGRGAASATTSVADYRWERARVPFSDAYLAAKVGSGPPGAAAAGAGAAAGADPAPAATPTTPDLTTLSTLVSILDARAREVGRELATVERLALAVPGGGGGVGPAGPGLGPDGRQRVELLLADLAAQERCAEAELADVEKEAAAGGGVAAAAAEGGGVAGDTPGPAAAAPDARPATGAPAPVNMPPAPPATGDAPAPMDGVTAGEPEPVAAAEAPTQPLPASEVGGWGGLMNE